MVGFSGAPELYGIWQWCLMGIGGIMDTRLHLMVLGATWQRYIGGIVMSAKSFSELDLMEMEMLYTIKLMTFDEVAEVFEVSITAVYYHFRCNNIPRRSAGESRVLKHIRK